MTSTSGDAAAALARTLGAPPPPSVAELEPAVLTRLTDAVVAEHVRQEQALGQAVDHALRLVPRPLRGLVRRLIGA